MNDHLKIAPWRLETGDVLGQGAFGIVYEGTWTRGKGHNAWEESVAIKILRNSDLIDGAWSEVKRMSRLDHPNVVKCFGISYPSTDDNDSPWIVMELMSGGDLHSYILDYAGGMPAGVMTKFAHEIAKGMKYLHHEMGQRHCDLAARNCLVGPNNTVKLGDFGKFEYDYEDAYFDWDHGHNLPCPLRWMPPENIPTWNNPKPRFTRKGDVWAYGVVLFEMWSRGKFPFEDLTNSEVKDALANEETPTDHCAVSCKWYIRNIMDECWNFCAGDRPNFKSIVSDLEEYAGHIVDIE